MIPVEYFCPLGSVCDSIDKERGVIKRCRWWTKVTGKHPQSEQDIEEWNCAMSWMPMMQVEVAQTNRSQSQAIEIQTKETLKRQDMLNVAVAQVVMNEPRFRIIEGEVKKIEG